MLRITNEDGSLEFSDEVVATIAGLATTECRGVVGMSTRRLKDGLTELLGIESLSKGVSVDPKGPGGGLSVELDVVVAYGVNIASLARDVREKVRSTIKAMTGLSVDKVVVHVRGVRLTDA